MGCKVDLDKLKWQKTILEAEKFQKQLALNDLMETSNKQNDKITTL